MSHYSVKEIAEIVQAKGECAIVGKKQVFELAVRLFKENPMRRALFASYLAKLGDERALPVLMEAAMDEKCKYMDFIELRNAIEMLGGEAPKKEFFEDEEYAALRAMEGDD